LLGTGHRCDDDDDDDDDDVLCVRVEAVCEVEYEGCGA